MINNRIGMTMDGEAVEAFASPFAVVSDAGLPVNQEADEQAGVFRFSRYFAYGNSMYVVPDLIDDGPLGDLVREVYQDEMGAAACQTAANPVRVLARGWAGTTVSATGTAFTMAFAVSFTVAFAPASHKRCNRLT
jgi:hypothetical protein